MNTIPKDFNPAMYLKLNPDVARNKVYGSLLGAIEHWKDYGYKEGRYYLDSHVIYGLTSNGTVGYIKFPDFQIGSPHSSGFYSNYFFVLSMIIDSDFKNLTPYVNLNNTAFVENYNPYKEDLPKNTENTWDWWFDQEIPTNTDVVVNILHSTRNFPQTKKIWGLKNLQKIKEINNKYIKIKQHILDEIDLYYKKNLKDKVVLGVMARGGEMNKIHPEYGDQTIETWIESTKKVLKEHPEINLIFLVTEDSNYIPIYINEFPNTKYLENVFRRTNEDINYMIEYPLWSCIAKPRENHCKRLGEECLIQAKLLSMCDYLLVKQCGTSSAAILFADDNLKDVIYT